MSNRPTTVSPQADLLSPPAMKRVETKHDGVNDIATSTLSIMKDVDIVVKAIAQYIDTLQGICESKKAKSVISKLRKSNQSY